MPHAVGQRKLVDHAILARIDWAIRGCAVKVTGLVKDRSCPELPAILISAESVEHVDIPEARRIGRQFVDYALVARAAGAELRQSKSEIQFTPARL